MQSVSAAVLSGVNKPDTLNRGFPFWTSEVLIDLCNYNSGFDGLKNSVPQWGIEPWSLTFWVSVITTRPPRHLSTMTFTPPPPPRGEACPHALTKQVNESCNWPPNITVKNSVPHWGIEPQSVTFQVSVITTRPPRQLSAVTFTPIWGKCVLTLRLNKQ